MNLALRVLVQFSIYKEYMNTKWWDLMQGTFAKLVSTYCFSAVWASRYAVDSVCRFQIVSTSVIIY